MLEMEAALRQPERLTVTGPDGMCYQGADQEWYPDPWQRRAGCGPTSASVLLCYLAASRTSLRALYPSGAMDQTSFLALMEQVWRCVTPGNQGLHQPKWYADGVAAYAAGRGLALSPEVLEIPAPGGRRPSWTEVTAFIRGGLAADCPVAFLNLSRGQTEGLDSWHWVTIIGIAGDQVTILDSGRAFPIDLHVWYDTTTMRGGFVRLRVPEEAL